MWAMILPALEWAGLLSGGYVLNDLFGWWNDEPTKDGTTAKPSINWLKVGFLLVGGIFLYIAVKQIVRLFKK